jgi:glucose/arabinose dehydrogenase
MRFTLIAAVFLCAAGCDDDKAATRRQPPRVAELKAPPGFQVTLFSDAVPAARSLARGAKGTIFVGTRKAGDVYALTDADGDGRAEKVATVASGLNSPNGVAFKDGALWVAETSRILRFDGIEDRLAQPPPPVVVVDTLPTEKHHGWKFIAFGPDGLLYVPVGAPCNVCEPEDPRFATILRFRTDGTPVDTMARGVRNTVGFDWDAAGALWFTDNGRDLLGDDVPADELNHAPQPGQHFGFPFCHAGDLPDPTFAKGRTCAEAQPPALKLGAHVAGLGMRFYRGSRFPAEYQGNVFLAEHGSWNRSRKVGYRVMRVRFQDGRPVAYEPFVEGWLKGEKEWGRPVDVLELPDGSLLVSDDAAGAIYRVTYGGA